MSGQTTLGSEGIIFNNTGNVTLNTVLGGFTGGLTLGGTGGTLTLPNPNTFTGAVNLNGGTVSLGSAAALGGTTSLVLTAGTLQASAAVTFPSTVAVTLNNSNVTIGVGGGVPVTFTGTDTVDGNSTVTFSNLGGTYFNGQLTGSGQLILAGTDGLPERRRHQQLLGRHAHQRAHGCRRR